MRTQYLVFKVYGLATALRQVYAKRLCLFAGGLGLPSPSTRFTHPQEMISSFPSPCFIFLSTFQTARSKSATYVASLEVAGSTLFQLTSTI